MSKILSIASGYIKGAQAAPHAFGKNLQCVQGIYGKIFIRFFIIIIILLSNSCVKKSVIISEPLPMRYQQSKKPEATLVYKYNKEFYYIAPPQQSRGRGYYGDQKTVDIEVLGTIGLVILGIVFLGAFLI